jgi:GNAT superfamily N-acetyltransferase
MFELRPMTARDVDACEVVWDRAWRAMREAYALPMPERTEASVAATQRRIAHLLRTDPDGAVVATVEGAVVGFAQALVRDDLWVLSLFGVLPEHQGHGIGRAVLDGSLECSRDRPGLILVSRDPIASRRYAAAGFDLHPAMTAWGTIDHAELPPSPPAVREGGRADLALVDDVARAARGAGYGSDAEFLLDEGSQLLVHDDGGFVFCGRRPYLLAARDERVATDLLVAALHREPPGGHTEFGWLTAPQQWAMRVAHRAGLELHPVGPVGLRGLPSPPAPCLPTGAFG